MNKKITKIGNIDMYAKEGMYEWIENDDIICKVEEELVRVIIPPCNSQIPYHYCDLDQPLS